MNTRLVSILYLYPVHTYIIHTSCMYVDLCVHRCTADAVPVCMYVHVCMYVCVYTNCPIVYIYFLFSPSECQSFVLYRVVYIHATCTRVGWCTHYCNTTGTSTHVTRTGTLPYRTQLFTVRTCTTTTLLFDIALPRGFGQIFQHNLNFLTFHH